MKYKRLQRVFACVITLSCLVFTQAMASPLSELQQLLGGFTSYQADFKQWVVNDAERIQSRSSGTFEIKRPAKFRWYTKSPNNTLIIANGNTLWHYDVDLQQATKQTLKPGSNTQNPAMILSSQAGALGQNFKVSEVTLSRKQWFLLVPKSPQSYKEIYLYFDQGKLAKIIVLNNLGDRSLFEFSNIRLNAALPDTNFEFKPPKGVDVDVQQ